MMRNPKHMKPNIEFDSKKFLVFISKIIAIIGFFLIFGSIGGFERGSLDCGKFITYFATGVCICVAGVLAVKYFDTFEDDDDDE